MTAAALASSADRLCLYTWEVRQRVTTAREERFEVIDLGTNELIMRRAFWEYVRANPQAYFEFIKVFHQEECLAVSVPPPAPAERRRG